MDLSIDHENLSCTEASELTGLRDDLVEHPVVQRVVDQIRKDADQGPSGHSKHASHSTHQTHSSGWLSPKR
jgi:hypothetical protein